MNRPLQPDAHSPLCWARGKAGYTPEDCQCALIAEVRADVIEEAARAVEAAQNHFVRITGSTRDEILSRVYADAARSVRALAAGVPESVTPEAAVACPVCGANAGQDCLGVSEGLCHSERFDVNGRSPVVPFATAPVPPTASECANDQCHRPATNGLYCDQHWYGEAPMPGATPAPPVPPTEADE